VRDGLGGFGSPLLLWSRAEHVGAEVVLRDAIDPGYRKRELWRHRSSPSNPLAHELRSRADSFGESHLAPCRLYRHLDWGCAHGARVAVLSRHSNSIATSFFDAPLLALLYG